MSIVFFWKRRGEALRDNAFSFVSVQMMVGTREDGSHTDGGASLPAASSASARRFAAALPRPRMDGSAAAERTLKPLAAASDEAISDDPDSGGPTTARRTVGGIVGGGSTRLGANTTIIDLVVMRFWSSQRAMSFMSCNSQPTVVRWGSGSSCTSLRSAVSRLRSFYALLSRGRGRTSPWPASASGLA